MVCLCTLFRYLLGIFSNGAETCSSISSVVTSDRALAACKLDIAGFSRSLRQTVQVFDWLRSGVNEQCLRVPFPRLCCKEGNLWDTNISAIFCLVQLFLKWASVQSSVDAHKAFLLLTLHQFTKWHELSWRKFFFSEQAMSTFEVLLAWRCWLGGRHADIAVLVKLGNI